MCYDDQALPPLPPGQRAAAAGEDIVLTAADGTRFAAYSASAATEEVPGAAAVIIYPDVRGLHNFYKELAMRFAEVGVPAVAIDYFGRTAGLGSRDEGFDFWPHVHQLSLDTFEQDVRAAIDYARGAFGQDAALFVVGFCMGGGLVLMTGADPGFGFSGLIPFYAGLTRDLGRGSALEVASRIAAPVLGIFGGADEGIPASAVQDLDEQLDAARVEHTLHIYPGAPHSFFDRKHEEFADASDDAWRRVLAFVD
ncbi:MAG TPA: dienelactone hydrolase family protein, partial [Herpetosiphonaceae bacterium]|nr:dienelactone hydrolase family protein [Herpetosiphonaceae bacterium]